MKLSKKILLAFQKFDLNLKRLNVLTEAASGNFVVTPIIAALAGADVYALTKDSKYGTIEEVTTQTYELAKELNVESKIQIVRNVDNVCLETIDILASLEIFSQSFLNLFNISFLLLHLLRIYTEPFSKITRIS